MFEWLASELAACKTPQFHITDGPMPVATREVMHAALLPASKSYREFAARFGNTKLFRSGVESHRIDVYAAPRGLTRSGYAQFVCIGRAAATMAYFDTSQPPVDGESAVCEWTGGKKLLRTDGTFAMWMERKWRSARRKYTAAEWKRILAGPVPFTPRERDIVAARQRYTFRKVGVTPENDVEIEIHNGSDTVLECIQIGVRNREGGLEGGVMIRTGHIFPGETKVVARDCYKRNIPASQVELVELPALRPEDRPFRWELGRSWSVQ